MHYPDQFAQDVTRKVFANNIGSIELNIGKITFAAISTTVGNKFSVLFPSALLSMNV
jgi:hypothetical protein